MALSDIIRTQLARARSEPIPAGDPSLVSLLEALLSPGHTVTDNDPLTTLANRFGSDKGNQLFCRHHYTRIYDRFLSPRRQESLTLLEIGLLRTEEDQRRSSVAEEGSSTVAASNAPSLEMWRAYFPNASLFGFDIDDFSAVRMDRTRIVQGDMSDRSDLERLVGTTDRPFDIIIDDGSHVSHHQQIALGFLFSYLAPGGLYVIEDMHWQDPKYEKADAPKTRDILRSLGLGQDLRSPFMLDEERTYVQAHTQTVHLFDTLEVPTPQANDALAFVRKTA